MPAFIDAMRQLWFRRGNTWARDPSWFDPLADQATTGGQPSGDQTGATSMREDELKHRIAELLAECDSMRVECWAKDIALRVLAEKIVELEGEL